MTATDEKPPYYLNLFEAPWGPDILREQPVADLPAALAIIQRNAREHGPHRFRLVHRDTADTLLSGEVHPTPNADAYEAARADRAGGS